jgi:O-antigen ligase
VNKYLKPALLFSLGLSVISSQWSVAASSIGIGMLVIMLIVKYVIEKKIDIDRAVMWLFFLFIVSQVISSLLSPDYLTSFSHLFRRIPQYAVFIGSVLIIRDGCTTKRFLAVFFLFSGLICLIEIIKFIGDYTPYLQLSEYRLQYFGYPVTNGAIKMLIILLLVPFIFHRKNFILKRWILILILILLITTLFLTNARSAFLGLFISLIAYGAICNRYFVLIFVIVVTAALLIAPPALTERIMSIADLNHMSNRSRIVMWNTAFEIFKDSPVFGHGDIDINQLYRKYKIPEFHGEGSHMHNNIIQLTVNFGLFGLLIWSALMIRIIIKQLQILNITRNDEFTHLLAVVSLCSMIAFNVAGLTEWNFGDAEFAVVMWFSLSLAFIAGNIYNAERHSNNI